MGRKTIRVGAAEGIAVAENEGLDVSDVQVNTLEAHPFTEDYEPTHKATSEAKFHKPGQPIVASSTVIEKMVKLGWAVPLALAFMLLSFIAPAQEGVIKTGVTMVNALATSGVYPVADTVTNTATATVGLYVPGAHSTVSIHWEATEISGTTAGTVSLLGSNDGVNYRSISSTTFTATDVATQGGIWILTGSPTLYFRVSWTGVGTMSDILKAKLLAH